jgi:hypothetical protein
MASMLDRAIAAIADFNNPFYAEERQRDVANEAAAFGFGVLVWTLLFGAGATCWFFPEHYMAAGVLAVWVFLVGGLTSLYARRLGVTFVARDRNSGYLRQLTYGMIGAWVGAGWVRARLGVPRGDDLGILAFFVVVFALGLAGRMALTGQLRRPPHR